MAMAMAAPNDNDTDEDSEGDGDGDGDDVGALIYREVQLRKAEAAAAAAESNNNKTSTASAHQSQSQRTLSRNISPIEKQAGAGESVSLPSLQRKGAMKRRKREYSNEGDRPGNKVARKKHRHRYGCSFDGCTNKAQKGGVCNRHGAGRKLCSSEGCTNMVR